MAIKDPENTIIMETSKGRVVIALLPGMQQLGDIDGVRRGRGVDA